MATKSSRWMFCVYLDSAPINWRTILEETGLPFAISPLHDKDLELCQTDEDFNKPDLVEKGGEMYYYKKAHYHVLTYYDGPTTYKNVLDNLCKPLNATIPKKVESLKGMYEYHIHKNNPEKYQYDDRLREFINGFDKDKVDELTATQIKALKRELTEFIINNDIIEYSDLIEVLHSSNMINLEDVANSHTMYLNTFITSRRNKKKDSTSENQLPIIDNWCC